MKISFIGAGNVGATAAMIVAQKGLGDVVLVDIAEGIPQGKALDIQHAMPIHRSGVKVTGSNDYSEIRDSDVVVVTAGIPRKPDMSRDDLLKVNDGIVRSISRQIREKSPGSVVIVVTNPLDAMVYAVLKETGFPPKRVMGMAGVLDSTRFRSLISDATGVKPDVVEAMVLGGHGDSMVPLIKHTKVKGKPITGVLDGRKIGELVERTRNSGAEVISHLKTGSAYYAPGASIAEMVEAVITDSGKVLPVSAYLQGEYGYRDICLGVPVTLGREGITGILELDLSVKEKRLLDKSAGHVKDLISKLGN
jgi:malate dehydrogenase